MNLKIDRVIRIGLKSDRYDTLKQSIGFHNSDLTEIWFDSEDLTEYNLTFPYLLGDETFKSIMTLFDNNQLDYVAIYLDV